ncbi:hypothetical protein [Bdellovibrio bacteriovorus]|uniref:YCII-related domain-containing protein n=1 Tax=Bdellovibrio bacteriovorus TaxID=959 RepID=A0A150WGK4_BDEBC|nr:hypothetical protein [Bdellovibrio bacteriovorus]KYG61951.1 hypothetical protein AZI85_07000 [Bdellovibrio bacteriovorus]
MKNFLAIFTCAENSKAHEAWKTLSPEEQADRMEKGTVAREQWAVRYKSAVVYEGGPLGNTKLVDTQGVQDIPALQGNFIVVKAESLEKAAQMFLDHPHFAIFPGDGVQVMEILDAPRG